jgi:hypothetical protein
MSGTRLLIVTFNLLSIIILFLQSGKLTAGEIPGEKRQPCILFPSPMYDKLWQQSIGFMSTTTPEDLTEEVRVRVPAGDWHVLRKINSSFIAEGRLLFQVVQNRISLGAKYSTRLGKRTYFSIGDDQAYWLGYLMVATFDSKGHGWSNYLNASFGYRTDKDLLITLKSEALFNISYSFSNGGYEISRNVNHFNGYSWTLAIEQPFYNHKHLTLGFTALYTDFYWQMWSLFQSFDRKLFYPQITVGFII